RPQAERLDRSLGLVAEVLPAATRALRQQPAQGQGAVRDRLPRPDARALAARFRHAADQGRGAPADPQAERGPAAQAGRVLRRRRRTGQAAARQITISPSPTVSSAFSTRSSRWTRSLNAASARPF